jgi:hypothetical protein
MLDTSRADSNIFKIKDISESRLDKSNLSKDVKT